jgi:hypothetical protein
MYTFVAKPIYLYSFNSLHGIEDKDAELATNSDPRELGFGKLNFFSFPSHQTNPRERIVYKKEVFNRNRYEGAYGFK